MVRVPEFDTPAVFMDTPCYDSATNSIYAQDFGAATDNVYRFDMATMKYYTATVTGATSRATTIIGNMTKLVLVTILLVRN